MSGVGSPIRGTGTPLLVYTVHWVLCTVHWVVCTVFLLVYTVHWVAYTLHWVMCTAPNYLYLSLCLCLLPMPLVVCTVHCTELLSTYLCQTPPYYPTQCPRAKAHSALCSSVLQLLMTENSAFEHLEKVRISNFLTRVGG